MRNSTIGLSAVLLCGLISSAQAAPGVSDDTITFGQTAAFEGPAAALGQGMRLGILAAFEEANRAGGIQGRTLKLVHLDDGYEPKQAAANTRKLIEEDQVFSLIGITADVTDFRRRVVGGCKLL